MQPAGARRFLSEFPDLYLVRKNGAHERSEDVLSKKKYALVYFSAHWCPPCQRFTPKLADFYTAHKDTRGKEFEVIFVSSDRTEKHMMDYFQVTHGDWCAIPFGDLQSVGRSLANRYRVSSIPYVVIINVETGEIISKDARNMVLQDPTASQFPWQSTQEIAGAGSGKGLAASIVVAILLCVFYLFFM